MNKTIMRNLGLVRQVEHVNLGLCPLCSKKIIGFRDKLSEKEYQISGLCQKCQDSFFEETK